MITQPETITEINSSLITRMEAQPLSLQLIINTISKKKVDLKEGEGKWNIHEIVAHLVVYQQMFIERTIQTLKEEVPFFAKYEPENDPDFKYWKTDDLHHLLDQFFADREKMIVLVKSLSEDKLNRIAMHKKFGSHSIAEWLDYFLLHEAHHIYKIFELGFNIEIK